MKKKLAILLVIISNQVSAQTWTVQGNESEYTANLIAWEKFINANKWGTSEDYWLEKRTPWGWEKVGVIMGYGDDWLGCEDIKSTLQKKYMGRAEYRCLPTN